MKKNIIYLLMLLSATIAFNSCSDDDPSGESIINVPTVENNEFDNWLLDNYIYPYNIDFKYRMEDIESDMNYTLVPATYSKAVQLAKLVKHLCLSAYDEVGGITFTRSYFPKMIHVIGSAAYNNNGTMILGVAENSNKITLYNANNLNADNVGGLTEYFKTIHHEFGHILNQTKNYPTDFQAVSGSKYVGDNWKDNHNYLAQGFISAYASKEDGEDFVELLSIFLTHDEYDWQDLLSQAGSGAVDILTKFEIVENYMKDTWGIDIYQLRSVVQRRMAEVKELDLNHI